MESKVNYTLVGLFVIILGAAVGAGVIWLTFGTQHKVYHTYLVHTRESVAGLNPGASVKYNGVDVGRVASIKLDPQNPQLVTISLDIEQGTPIRQDTIAKLANQGITGLLYVELSGGTSESPPLVAKPEEPPPVIKAVPSLVTRLDDAFTNFQNTFNTLSSRLEAMLSRENQRAFSQTLSHLDTITGAVASRSGAIEQTLTNVETVTNTLAARSESLGKALDETVITLKNSAQASSDLSALVARAGKGAVAIEEMVQSITQTSRELNKTVRDSRQQILQLAKNTTPEFNALLVQLSQLAQALDGFVQELNRNPRMLLLGRPSGRPGPGE